MAKLFHVQDSDRPMHVEANDFREALERWRLHIADENSEPIEETTDPTGVALVADEYEFLPL